MSNPNDFLMGGGTRSARITPKGLPVSLRITQDPEVRQQTDYNTKLPKTFPNGDPMNQLVVTGQTSQHDLDDPADDGIRAMYIKGKQMTGVVREAVKAAGARGLEIGGELSLTWVSGGPRYEGDTSWQKDSPKVYAATYTKPAGASAAFLATEEPATQPAPASGDGCPAGFDPNTWAQLDANQRGKVRAAMGLA